MPTSSEFIALCRSQVTLLTQALGASLSIVYLTEELVENAQARLVPVAAYPNISVALEKANRLALMPEVQPQSVVTQGEFEEASPLLPQGGALTQPRQLVLPLMHEEMVLGLLVTERDDRPWTTWERSQVERIAETLSLAVVMDQRAQWLDQNQRQQRLVQTQQHDVLDNLLHQLRSPLTALRTFGKLLMKRLSIEDSNRDIAVSIVQQSDRLQELLQQFDEAISAERNSIEAAEPAEINLDSVDVLPNESTVRPIPLLPAGVLTGSNLELTPCSVTEILQPLLASAQAIAQEKGISLKTDIPTALPPVLGNGGALREVLSNLVDNALKYTPAEGEVHIRVNQLDSASLTIWVTDTGLGIPSEDLPRLFERHYRGVQAQGDIPGTGLGLAIARRLLEQMQGSIQVFSPLKIDGWIARNGNQPPINKGTTVVVELKTIKG